MIIEIKNIGCLLNNTIEKYPELESFRGYVVSEYWYRKGASIVNYLIFKDR